MGSAERFCAADPVFFESPTAGLDERDGFGCSARDGPPGWARSVTGDWVLFRPGQDHLPGQGWKIHVSAVLGEAEDVLATVFDYCVEAGVAFKFLRSPRLMLLRNAKYAPRGSSGKLATIYPADEPALERVLHGLGELLAGRSGPYVLSDLRWRDGPLYVRYGGFARRECLGPDGSPVPAITDGAGELVPDVRGPVFAVPSWVRLPAVLEPALRARNAVTTAGLAYDIEGVLHFSNGGGVYAGRHRTSGERVVLKEARPHAGLDAVGRDALTRLRQERDMLRRLDGLDGVPRVLDHLAVGEHEFLVLGFVDGVGLNTALARRHPLVVATEPDPERLAEHVRWVIDVVGRVERLVAAVHARGVVHGDIHLFNILLDDEGAPTLIDFEVASPIDDPAARGLRSQAFGAPRDRAGFAVDQHALACLRLALFLPLTALLALDPGKAGELAEAAEAELPVPAGFLRPTVAALTTTGSGRSGGAGWSQPDARCALMISAIHATASPERDDRLFPGDPEQFATGGLGLAHGAAGVLHALHEAGAPRRPEHEDWLVRQALAADTEGLRAGLYDGLAGVAVTLHRLGHAERALDVIDRALRVPWSMLGPDLYSGLAGVGLGLLELAVGTGEAALRKQATEAAEVLADRLERAEPVAGTRAGLMHGASGPALLFLRIYEHGAGVAWLDRAARALRRDLDRCRTVASGGLHVDEGRRTMPYLAEGSTGIGVVVHRYLGHRDDEELRAAQRGIHRAARGRFSVQPALFRGVAGMVAYLTTVAADEDPESWATVDAQLDRLGRFAVRHGPGLAFPGEKLLRLSMDLATGTAGILLVTSAAAARAPAALPLIGSATSAPGPVPAPGGGERR